MDDNPNNAQPDIPADPATVFTALAEILYQGADTTEVCAAICVAATLTVPGCDHASVLMRRNDDYVTWRPLTRSRSGRCPGTHDQGRALPRRHRRRSTPGRTRPDHLHQLAAAGPQGDGGDAGPRCDGVPDPGRPP